MATPKRLDLESRSLEMKRRLENCWSVDIDWDLFPNYITKVCDLEKYNFSVVLVFCWF